MKLSVKTLKGEVFQIEAEGTEQISDLKQKIQAHKSDLVAERQKLIHSGKVLKDDQTIESIGIKDSDFVVCMITKEVAKKAAPAPTPAAAPAATTAPTSSPAPASVSTPAAPSSSTPSVGASPTTPIAAPSSFVTAESVASLVGMGFEESGCRAALEAAMDNPDLAYEFLLTGIPDHIRQATAQRATAAAGATGAAAGGPVTIDQLRQHPQFNNLKRLVQQNPAALYQVLETIGQQNPAMLTAIHANNAAFIAMMNEPIVDTPEPAHAPATTSDSWPSSQPFPVPGAGAAGGAPAGMGMGGPMGDPSQVIQMLAAMPADQRAQFAQTLGMSPEQLEGFMSMMSSIPPQELQSILGQQAGAGGMAGGRDPPGVIRLSEEEMAAVNRLMGLGFSQQQAAQAYLACDKNEDLAANLLLERGLG